MTRDPKSARALVIASVMTSMFMIAIEATIVSTAMPQIVAQLGGLHLYSWIFSSFLLTQTAMPITDVSIACGFSTAAHFSTAYRHQFGCTPSTERTTS